jgi:hypothetical protein
MARYGRHQKAALTLAAALIAALAIVWVETYSILGSQTAGCEPTSASLCS